MERIVLAFTGKTKKFHGKMELKTLSNAKQILKNVKACLWHWDMCLVVGTDDPGKLYQQFPTLRLCKISEEMPGFPCCEWQQ